MPCKEVQVFKVLGEDVLPFQQVGFIGKKE